MDGWMDFWYKTWLIINNYNNNYKSLKAPVAVAASQFCFIVGWILFFYCDGFCIFCFFVVGLICFMANLYLCKSILVNLFYTFGDRSLHLCGCCLVVAVSCFFQGVCGILMAVFCLLALVFCIILVILFILVVFCFLVVYFCGCFFCLFVAIFSLTCVCFFPPVSFDLLLLLCGCLVPGNNVDGCNIRRPAL